MGGGTDRKLGHLTAAFLRGGVVRWDRYDGVVSFENEDRVFERPADLVERGFRIARDALWPYLY